MTSTLNRALAETFTADAPPRMRALIYSRISLDRAGMELGVQRQTEDSKALCGVRGWDVAGVFEDNDARAMTGAHRPAYAALMAAVARGEGDVVVLFHTSRLWRNRMERATGIKLLADRSMSIIATQGGDIDLSTAMGRAMAGLLGEFDTMEGEIKGERMRAQNKQAAAMGKMPGASSYGHRIEYLIVSGTDEKVRRRIIPPVRVDPVEGPIVVECAERILEGESIMSVARDLNARGIPTKQGKQWNRTILRRMLCSARIAGYREHHGVITAKAADWEPIITLQQCEQLRLRLRQPERRTTTGPDRKHLLSGILSCGRCGHPMVGRTGRYVCNRDVPALGCGLSIVKDPTDEFVTAAVLHALTGPATARLLTHRGDDVDGLYDRIQTDEHELEKWAARAAEGKITDTAFDRAAEVIMARIAATRQKLAESAKVAALDGFIGSYADMRVRWESMNVSQRRGVITAVVKSVPVSPTSKPGYSRFDVERLRNPGPVWRVA